MSPGKDAETFPFETEAVSLKENRERTVLGSFSRKKPVSLGIRAEKKVSRWCMYRTIKINEDKVKEKALLRRMASQGSSIHSESLASFLSRESSSPEGSLYYWESGGRGKTGWKDSFKSIYSSFMATNCGCFYFLQSQLLSVLFLRCEDGPNAFLKGNTRLQSELKEDGIAFSADGQLLKVAGAEDIHFLFNYLLNQPDSNSFDKEPTLCSAYPFLGSVLSRVHIRRGAEKGSFFHVEGAILPHTHQALFAALGSGFVSWGKDTRTAIFESIPEEAAVSNR